MEPAARYPTARDLAADIGHWLADQPVSVYADPISTRLLRWARRRRTFVSAGLALLVASVVGLAIINLVVRDQKQRAELAQREAQEAQREAQAAERRARDHLALGLTALDELVTVGDRQLISQATAGKRGQFLGLALEFVRQFAEREPGNVAVRRRASLVVRRLANLSMLTGQVDEADRLHDESVASMEALHADHPDEADLPDLLAEALLDRATSRLETGRVREALADLDRAEVLARTNLQTAPGHAPFLRTLGRTLDGKAQALDALGRPGATDVSREAISLLTPPADETLSRVREALGRGDNLPFFSQLLLAEALIHRAEFLHREGDSAGAATTAAEARARMEELARLLGDPPIDGLSYALAYARLKENHLGGPADLDSVVTVLDRLAEKHPEMVLYRLVLAEALQARAARQVDPGDPNPAALDAERSFLIAEEILATSPRLLAAWTLRAQILETMATAMAPPPAVVSALRASSARSLAVAAALSPDNPRLKAQAAAAQP
jgi:tetratricopeptide (TPR) repeat protein